MQVIYPGQAAKLLISRVSDAQQRMACHRAEVVAVAMDRQLAALAQVRERGKADVVDAHHDAGARVLFHQIVAAQHVIDIAADIECVHRLLAGLIRYALDLGHDCRDALGERRIGRIGVELIVFDEVEAGQCEVAHQLAKLLCGQADAGLDDRADQRTPIDLGELTRAFDSEAGARIALGKGLRKLQIEQADPGQLLELIEVSGDGREQIRNRGSEVVQRERNDHLSAPVLDACALGARRL